MVDAVLGAVVVWWRRRRTISRTIRANTQTSPPATPPAMAAVGALLPPLELATEMVVAMAALVVTGTGVDIVGVVPVGDAVGAAAEVAVVVVAREPGTAVDPPSPKPPAALGVELAVVRVTPTLAVVSCKRDAQTGWPLMFMQTWPRSMVDVSVLAPAMLYVVATATIEP